MCAIAENTEKPREQKLPSPMVHTHTLPSTPFSHHRAWNPHCVSASSLRQNSQVEFRGRVFILPCHSVLCVLGQGLPVLGWAWG